MEHRFQSEEERQLLLKAIASNYEEKRGIDNFINLDIDGNYVVKNPIVEEDDDLDAIRESVSNLVFKNRTNNILFVVNMYKTAGDKSYKCIIVHMCNPVEEHAYIAKCKKKGSRKFLGPFDEIDFGGQTKGIFGDIFELRRYAV